MPRLSCLLLDHRSGSAEQLDLLAIDRGLPKALRMDDGPELVSKALDEWASETGRIFIPPGQTWKNGFVKSFNGKLRNECPGTANFTPSRMQTALLGCGSRNTAPSGRPHPWDIQPRAFMLANAPTKINDDSHFECS